MGEGEKREGKGVLTKELLEVYQLREFQVHSLNNPQRKARDLPM